MKIVLLLTLSLTLIIGTPFVAHSIDLEDLRIKENSRALDSVKQQPEQREFERKQYENRVRSENERFGDNIPEKVRVEPFHKEGYGTGGKVILPLN